MNEKITCEDCKRFNAKNNVCALLEKTVRPGYGCYEGEPRIITNGDRIRQMSDEELVTKFWFKRFPVCPDCPDSIKDCGTEDCKTRIVNWLKREAPNE